MQADSWERLARFFAEAEPRLRQEQIRINELPSPTGHEVAKAAWIGQRLRGLGLVDVTVDEVSNVYALAPGGGTSPTLVLCAHLDTAFTPGTSFRVKQEGERLVGAGIGDNSGGLVALLWLAEAMKALALACKGRLIFFFPVGEEGRGDLRGTRHFFAHSPFVGQVDGFAAVDHGSPHVVAGGIGSRRWEIVVHGPGGHSWGDFGRVNPIAVLSSAVAAWNEIDLSGEPRRICSVGVVSGGTTVNAVPAEARLELDMRCTQMDALLALERDVMTRLELAVRQHNQRRIPADSPPARLTATQIGERPTGHTPQEHPLVQASLAALRQLGYQPACVPSSTDANVPMSLGIPAVTLWRGGRGGMVHTPEEWFEPVDRDKALLALMHVVDAMVGLGN